MSFTSRTTCRSCEGQLQVFLSLGEQPLANRLRKPDEPLEVPRYPLTLCRCTSCELVQLREVVDPSLLFHDYAYVPSTSTTMRTHFEGLASWAVKTLGLGSDDLVVDVGSNDGLLLSYFQRCGTQVMGIEPAANLAQRAIANGIPTVSAFFDAEVARRAARDKRASLVCATNVFAHVDNVREFMRAAFELLSPNGVFLVEVQSFADTVASLAFDMTYHEHMTYYATAPLVHLCRREGLELLDVERVSTHGGSLRAVIGRPGHPLSRPARVAARIAEESPMVGEGAIVRFARGAETVREELRTLLCSIRESGGRVAGYGAPAKATVLLNYCDLSSSDIAWIVDRNAEKQGCFIPGANIGIVGPERIEADPPSHLLLLAWNLSQEVMEEQKAFRQGGGRFVIPVPHPRVLE